ncbi:hypothetical protein GCM10027277_07410 [Pseudoduganella ginsengisoli]|uniref:Uncharacterized protein n=1 Tax=Pseudoduganella ginsengisoli TaxID=1462440 RepID=A0A6L6Q9R4_9BURK|nr:hypothetical protein [Pseudoduganella ginsengisoli]MTW05938.1 hypothetical protein [Pseudoduganella ginsengisoli]
MMNYVKRIAFPVLFCCFGSAWATDAKVIHLHYGVNQVNFAGAGAEGLAVLGRRENFNAHGFDVLTLYLKPKQTSNGAEDWQLVSLFDGQQEALTVNVGGGADCTLHDFRLVPANGSVSLIVADRELGTSFADAAPVKFKHYALRHNASSEMGHPLYYFELVKTSRAKRSYCDVGDAFEKELRIGPYRQ